MAQCSTRVEINPDGGGRGCYPCCCLFFGVWGFRWGGDYLEGLRGEGKGSDVMRCDVGCMIVRAGFH